MESDLASCLLYEVGEGGGYSSFGGGGGMCKHMDALAGLILL